MADKIKPSIVAWKNQGYGILIDPKKKITVTNIQSGTRTVLQFPIWFGAMRIQPIKTDLTARNQTNDTTTRPVQFWLDFPKDQTIPDIYPGLEIVVTDGGNDPFLPNYQYSVTGAMNSSMAWQRTVNTIVNMESRPNYQWAYVTGTITPNATAYVEYYNGSTWVAYYGGVQVGGIFTLPVFDGVIYRIRFTAPGYYDFVTSSIDPTSHGTIDIGDISMVVTSGYGVAPYGENGYGI